MSKGADKNYHFGPKNHWRRSIWNEVLRRTAGREKTEPILYLAGPKDEDRSVAIAKGVPSQNLIAIDRCERNVMRVRAEGVPAVTGDALDVLWSWPDDRPACAVMMDFCCGHSKDTLGLFDVFQRQPFQSAVGMVNFQRGRDAWANVNRDAMKQAGLYGPMWRPNPACPDGMEKLCEPEHRGSQFLLFHAMDMWATAVGRGSGELSWEAGAKGAQRRTSRFACMPYVHPDDPNHQEWVALISVILSSFRPKLFSYKSGVLTMDSAVWESPWRVLGDARVLAALPALKELHNKDMRKARSAFSVPSIARRIAATLAVRTRRLIG